MTHACESLDITLARDVAAKKFSWFILPGRSMAFVKFDSSYVPQAWIPPAKPATGSTEDQSPKLSAFWYPRGVAKLRPTLNPYLQAYFYKIQHIMPRTCHPSVIHHEARLIIHSVSAGLNHSQPKLSGDAVAKALFLVGTARPEYSRTVALLVYDVLVELNLSNWLAMRTLRIHLEDVATSTILKAWSNLSADPMRMPQATGLEGSAHPLKKLTRDEMLNAATFYGDLVAVGIISCSLLNSVITGLLDCLTSESQCHMLYLLLVRATFCLASPIDSDYLLDWRNRLLRPRPIKLAMDNEMVKRWIIELCNVIDKAVVQHQAILQAPANTYSSRAYVWDTKLTGQRLHESVFAALTLTVVEFISSLALSLAK